MGYKKRKSKHAARVDHQNEILKVIQLFEKYPLLTSNARARYSVFLHCFKNRDSLSYEGLVEAKSKLQDMRDIAPATPSPLWPWLRHRPRWLQPRDCGGGVATAATLALPMWRCGGCGGGYATPLWLCQSGVATATAAATAPRATPKLRALRGVPRQ